MSPEQWDAHCRLCDAVRKSEIETSFCATCARCAVPDEFMFPGHQDIGWCSLCNDFVFTADKACEEYRDVLEVWQ